ncbi:histidine kinase [Lacinutrix mariniflava]|uniref:sensor histidine kinase n=1 Tax=Lacinutrix mariniflava TaxID=342955 RepID=UPI00128EB602|nr:histidine kinase [Lacinutrix mariniflava]
MNIIKRHITLLFILIWHFSFAQQFTNYTTKEGLPSKHVYKMTQDVKGFIWIATDKGLVKYNGTDFKKFTTKDGLANNDVWEIYPTPDGKVWYLSKTSKLGYIENDSVHAFESEEKGEIFNPILSSQIGNEIFLTSTNKTHVLKDGKWRLLQQSRLRSLDAVRYLKHPIISYFKTTTLLDSLIIQDKNNKTIKKYDFNTVLKKNNYRGQITDSLFYWVNDKQYNIINLNTLELYKRTFKDEIGIEKSKHVRLNLINNQIQVSGEGFVGILDKDLHIKQTYYIPSNLKAHFGFIDKTGSIWISTFTNGIYQLPIEKQNVNYCLVDKSVTNINNVNNKIIANVFSKGFYEYDILKDEFVPYINEESYIYNATFIKELDTEYYISKRNLKAVRNNIVTEVKVDSGLYNVNDKARELAYYNDYLYGVYSVGINKINPNSFNVEASYAQSGINHLFTFNNMLLVATSNGLKFFKDGKFESVNFTNQEFNKSILKINKISNKEVLLNTDGFGAFISDLKTIKQLPDSEFLIVNNAFIENEIIWLATESGVLKYEKVENNYSLKQVITKNDGLPSNSVSGIIVKGEELIVSTNNGIAILPKNQENKSQLLDIYFENVRYNNKPIVASCGAVLDYVKNNSMNVSISSLDFSENNTNLLYNYRLEPIQKEWIYSNVKTINFNDLQPGEYELEIQSNAITKSLNFTIEPLWWQTFWFKIASVLLVVVIIVYMSWELIRRLQFKKNKKIVEEKRFSELQLSALRSQMNPHFVFNSLAAIQYYINNNQMEASEAYLVKFSKLIRQFFEWSKEKEISLEKEVELLTNYLDIEKLRFKDKFQYVINLDEKLKNKTTKLPTMLLQPIVENAINHGIFNKMENGNVTINFIALTEKQFKVEVIDDGVGFINTKKRGKRKVKSSNVLADRLKYLNQSGHWEIFYSEKELHPSLNDKGNISIFIITQL